MDVVRGYLDAFDRIVDTKYGEDIVWADGLQHVQPDPQYVLREGAWVIVNSGFRNAVARKLWPLLQVAFNFFDPEIVGPNCLPAALHVLAHEKKMSAIVELARLVREDGIGPIVADAKDPPRLRRLPFIGPITCWHFAKLLGADVVKPDVHLVRAADAAGYASPLALCQVLQAATGDRLVIDSVLWRYGEQLEARGWPSWPALWGAG